MPHYIFWIIIVIILTVLEISTVNLVSVWFILSSLVSLLLSFFIDNFFIEFLVFVILGIILLITTKPLINKYLLKNKNVATNLDRVVGMIGVVTEDITNNEIGEVKADGKKWSAISNSEIKKGEYVKVEKINGVKLVVCKKESDK